MANVKIGHASGSEKGTITGAAGDQTGREVCTRTWYRHSKGWVTLRCLVPGMAEHMAHAMEVICANSNVGYDQHQNQTLWRLLQENGFDVKNINKKVETDCARLIRVCVQYAAIMMGLDTTIPDFYTATEAAVLVETGLFELLTESKYNTQDDYLERGMIQVTKTKGHTIMILGNGSKAKPAQKPAGGAVSARPTLRKGSKGGAVKTLQQALKAAGHALSVDGDFGSKTLGAVEKFQKAKSLEVDGVVGPKTWAALEAAQKPAGGAVNARRLLHKGDNGPEVEALQQALKASGVKGCDLPEHGADGDFGKETLAAVRIFQQVKGLEVDGIVGPKTWAALEV